VTGPFQNTAGAEKFPLGGTLIQTAKLNDVDPQAWLADVGAPPPSALELEERSNQAGGLSCGPDRSDLNRAMLRGPDRPLAAEPLTNPDPAPPAAFTGWIRWRQERGVGSAWACPHDAADVRDGEAARGWGMPAQNALSLCEHDSRSKTMELIYASRSDCRTVCRWPHCDRAPGFVSSRAPTRACAGCRGDLWHTGSVLPAIWGVGLSRQL
jgi:hypothetical protein